MIMLKSKGFNEFMKRKNFGSPVPANEILLPFQRSKRNSHHYNGAVVGPGGGNTGSASISGAGNSKHQTPPRSIKRHLKKPSESCIPRDLLLKSDQGMKVSVYRSMTLHIFHSINIIKQIKEMVDIEKE